MMIGHLDQVPAKVSKIKGLFIHIVCAIMCIIIPFIGTHKPGEDSCFI